MNPPVLSYHIFRSEEGAEPIEIANIANDGPELFTFTDDELLEPGHLYTYHVEATNADSRVSASCHVDVYPDPELLNAFDLDNVSVYNNEIQLTGSGRPAEFINEVVIYRSNTNADELKPLMTTPWDSPGMVIPETSAKVNDSAYYYQMVALDACGFTMQSSTVFRSIHLELQDMAEGNVRLYWNAFEGWGDRLVEYAIVRLIDGVVDAGYPQYVATQPLFYNDNVDPATENGRITYYVEGIRDDEVKSRSNEVLLPGEAEIVLPNAFKPGSDFKINRVLLPLVKNVEPSSYLFTVYNRWGQLVFETNDPLKGWNGEMNGMVSPAGVYAYLVIYSDYNGITHSQRGAVTLLR
jgi:gliding motility-associated-like protein